VLRVKLASAKSSTSNKVPAGGAVSGAPASGAPASGAAVAGTQAVLVQTYPALQSTEAVHEVRQAPDPHR
jgi:hypothetical protein